MKHLSVTFRNAIFGGIIAMERCFAQLLKIVKLYIPYWIGAFSRPAIRKAIRYKCKPSLSLDSKQILSKSTHEWPRMTTSDHEWPRVISVFKNHEIIIKTISRWLPKVFALYCTIVSRKRLFLHITWRRNLLDILTMLSWTLQCVTFVLKVRYHGNSVLRIRLKICLFSAILKIPYGIFLKFFDYCTRQSTGT
jgi:hypothetical protein